jgi:amicyanin
LRGVLGITHVNYIAGNHTLAVVDSTLGSETQQARLQNTAGAFTVKIDNFSFTPKSLTVKAGATVVWVNQDDIPHNVVSTEKKFSSPVLDTDQNFTFTFREPGTYSYYCKIHPMMTGTVLVEEAGSGKA